MDAKDLRTEPALSERSNDSSKYAQSGTVLQSNRNKSYQDIGSNPSVKVDAATVRPCAVIGPDRVVPPSDPNDAYLKKASVEPWPCSDSPYHRPPEYPHKAAVYHNPTRNISPRQTFQENMQRIMVPPNYNSVKVNEDASFIQKLNVTSDAKYCDVPYSVNPITNDPKNIRSVEMCLPNVNPALGRPVPHGWPPGSINVRHQRPYVASEMYQFPDYPSCAGPRPVSISRPHRTIPEESTYLYPENYYQDPNIRFKPYPNVKERYAQPRYDYITNYSNPFHPPGPPQKYEIPKSLPPHPYPGYPHFKYVDSRMPESVLEGYSRQVAQQGSYNIQYRNQIVHPSYGPVMNNNSQSKIPLYPPDGSFKPVVSNKLPYDSNGKVYVEYDNNRMKSFTPSEAFYSNEMSRHHAILKGNIPNYPSINVQSVPPNSYYKKDNQPIKNYEYISHFKNINPSINMNSSMQRHMPQFSPNAIAISPTDSNTSNETSQTHGTSQEDCGYVSQSSTTSIRSIEIGYNKIPNENYGRYFDPKYGPVIRPGPPLTKLNKKSNNSSGDNKDKKDMDVRKFLQMWSEGDDDNTENNSNKEIVVPTNSNELPNIPKQHGGANNNEQLYVLGLVNVPSEELSKYEHIQKVSKLPENIKGYNSIELLNQFEEVIESSNMNSFKHSASNNYQTSNKHTPKQTIGLLPRSVSPLDVEAKISQSVIHKEVGCNFEIKPCSPKMLNVEIAAPVQNILNERIIEKVTNPLSIMSSPMLNGIDDGIEHCNIPNVRQDLGRLEDGDEISSCKMINTQFPNTDNNSIKTNYNIQDFESNAGVCLASLPRLDNDIELNFPEVNQQFINANKVEPTMSTQIKDFREFSRIDHTDKNIRDITHSDGIVSNEPSPKVETEREFTKLSKYRKTKTNISDNRQDILQQKAVRTDSVIIKNPENTKSLENNKEQSAISKMLQINQQTVVNLRSQVDFVDAVTDNCIENEMNANNLLHSSTEEAIDFRLNKEHFDINSSFAKACEPLQLSVEKVTLPKPNLCDSTNEEIRSLDTKEEDIKSNHLHSPEKVDLTCTKNDLHNEIMGNEGLFELTPSASEPRSEKLSLSSMSTKMDESTNLTLEHTSLMKTRENEMSCLPEGTINKTVNFSIIDRDSLTEPQVETSTNSEIAIGHKATLDIDSYENCYTNQPSDGNIENYSCVVSPQIDSCLDKDNMKQRELTEETLQKESTDEIIAVQISDKKDDSVCNDNMHIITDISTVTSPQQHEDLELCEFKHNIEISEKSNIDEGFISIDAKQSCEQDIVPYCSADNDNSQIDNCIVLEKSKEPVQNKCFGYGSKELYSPWIQKLIMFNEGICCILSSDENKTLSENTSISVVNSQLENSTSGTCLENYCTSGNSNTRDIDQSLYSKDYSVDNLNAAVGDSIMNENAYSKQYSEESSSNSDCEKMSYNTLNVDLSYSQDYIKEKSNTSDLGGDFDNIHNDGSTYAEDSITENSNSKNCDSIDNNINNSTTEIAEEASIPASGCEQSGTNMACEEKNDDSICSGSFHKVTNDNDRNDTDEIMLNKISTYAIKSDQIEEILHTESDLNSSVEIKDKALSKISINDNIEEIFLNKSNKSTYINEISEQSNKILKDDTEKEIFVNSLTHIKSETTSNDVTSKEIFPVESTDNTTNDNKPIDCVRSKETYSSDAKISNPSIKIQEEFAMKKEDLCKIDLAAIKQNTFKNRMSLKRSLSDSALNILHSEQDREDISAGWPFKRRKLDDFEKNDESDIIAQNLCNILQNNRRNSISAVYTEENVSFCILIEDNTIINEDNDNAEKICFTEFSEDCLNEINDTYECGDNHVDVTIVEDVQYNAQNNCEYSDSVIVNDENDLSLHRTWVDDVARVETVVSDDIAEDIVISSASTPKENHFWDNDSNYYDNSDKEDDTTNSRYDECLSYSNAQFHELCVSPQLDVSEALIPYEIPGTGLCHGIYDNESLEKILSESNCQEPLGNETKCESLKNDEIPVDKENMKVDILSESNPCEKTSRVLNELKIKIDKECPNTKTQDGTVHSCESSVDNVFMYKHKDDNATYTTSSSPEVSSTTSEERNSGIMLKITNYKGSKVSQINQFHTNNNNRISCKFTEKTDYVNSNAKHNSSRKLITKAAQKYIPPIKESIRDLKVKLSLPPHSLLKLKQMQTSKDEPKLNRQSHPSILPKKPKPKFEDVLKSIDEIQIKMHKEKNKKVRKSIPKVVIKKNENGSHYASTSNKDNFNPDLTGRKWQPWVFLEKNNFIDKMATRRKTKAIFSHRKNAYVLAEKFHKYKSASSTKFIISQPKLDDSSTGQLKYTIRLKHSY